MTFVGVPNGLAYSRLAVSAPKRLGNATTRNRIKRLGREAFRLSRDKLPNGWDYMIIPRAGASFSLQGLSDSLIKLSCRLARRQDPPPSHRCINGPKGQICP